MRGKTYLIMLVALMACSTSRAQSPPINTAEFVSRASIGNMFEMEEAKLAIDRAADPRLKDFAKRMLAEHGDAEKKLRDASEEAKLNSTDKLDAPHQAMLDNLSKFNGADFDKIYMADEIAAHAEAANLLSDYKQNGDNTDLKSWAANSLPVVKDHEAAINAM